MENPTALVELGKRVKKRGVRPLSSIVICVRNVEKYIGKCIRSLLNQTCGDFEIILVDDMCLDKTSRIIENFDDKRILCVKNKVNLGIAKSRNVGLKLSKGEYVFFTDGDCIVSKDWIEQGIIYLEDPECVAVEGKIYYVSGKYKPTFSDYVCENKYGGQFMTGNVAYKKSVIERVGGFDEGYSYYEDRDLALRVARYGKIRFNPNMVAYVQQQTRSPKELIKSATHIINRIFLFKKFRERKIMFWRIVYPLNLAIAFFPPLVILFLFFSKRQFRKSEDFRLLPYYYVFAVCERLQLWKKCAKEKVFLI